MSFYDRDDVSPAMLRKLADMMEKENPEAYGKACMQIESEGRAERINVGMLDDGRPLAQVFTKRLQIEIDILSPVYIVQDDGSLVEIV